MNTRAALLIIAPCFVAHIVAAQCDINSDGTVNIADVQMEIKQALGASPCTTDLNGDGKCDIRDVQRVVTAALSGTCNDSGPSADSKTTNSITLYEVDGVTQAN